MRTIDPALMLAVIASEDAESTARRRQLTPPTPLPTVPQEPDPWEEEVTEELPRDGFNF